MQMVSWGPLQHSQKYVILKVLTQVDKTAVKPSTNLSDILDFSPPKHCKNFLTKRKRTYLETLHYVGIG